MASPDKHASIVRDTDAAFSLVEVVLALGICAFVLVAMIGLFQVGLTSARESEARLQAANMASLLIAQRSSSLTNTNFAIPAAALSQTYGTAFTSSNVYVGEDGRITTAISNALYRITCFAGTNTATGPYASQIYLSLSWPPQASRANSQGSYETLTYLPLR